MSVCRGTPVFASKALKGEALVFMLNARGICANTGSACASKALKVSPILCAIGISPEMAQGSLVFTLSPDHSQEDIDYVLTELSLAVEKLRSFSPVWRKKMAAVSGGQR